jgi:transglutaminase-like putative cysteine protease
MIGFSTRVDLGGVGKLRSDPTIAMRVHMSNMPPTPAPRLALYLRGTSFDRYDGGSWSRTRPAHETAAMSGSYVWLTGRPLGSEAMTIDLEPINPPIVFLPPDAVGFKLVTHNEALMLRRPGITVASDGEYKYESSEERGLQYLVYRGRARPEPLSQGDRERYLDLPQVIEKPVHELAVSWTRGLTDDSQIAAAVEQRLRTEYRYDLNSPSGGAPQPLLHFLFESKAGHCEFYSTAMAMLLRTLGVPTRNVTGFIGGSYNRFGDFYAVRQGDAHSWVEVYLEGRGWTRFDPTPPVSSAPRSDVTGMLAFARDLMEAAAQRWSRHVVGYDLDQQVELFRSVRQRYKTWGGRVLGPNADLIGLGLLVGAGAGLVYIGWRRGWLTPKRRRQEAASAEQASTLRSVLLYRQLEEVMRELGVARQSSTPPLAHARALVALNHPAASEVLGLTALYLQARFGRRLLDAADERDFVMRVKALRLLKQQSAA